ncbi:hypothetical protein YC2023_040541 [Brassica napus]
MCHGYRLPLALAWIHCSYSKIMSEIKRDVLQVVGKLDVSEESSTIIETMIVNGFQIPPSHEVFQDDLSDAYAALGFMRDAGFKLDWLEKKLYEVSERKKNEEAGLKEMEEDLRDLKHKCSDMEALANEEKVSAKTPISFDDEELWRKILCHRRLLSKAAPLLPGSSDRDNQHYHGNLKNVSSHVGYGYDEKKSFLDPRWLGWRPFA